MNVQQCLDRIYRDIHELSCEEQPTAKKIVRALVQDVQLMEHYHYSNDVLLGFIDQLVQDEQTVILPEGVERKIYTDVVQLVIDMVKKLLK